MHIFVGRVPDRLQLEISRYFSEGMLKILAGIEPVRKFPPIANLATF